MLSGTYGNIVIGLCVLLLLVSLCFALYTYIRRKRLRDANVIPQKYAIVEQNPDSYLQTKPNQIQPPTQEDAKLFRSRTYSRTRRKMIRYSDIIEDDDDDVEPDNTFQNSMRNYRHKISDMMNKNKSTATEDEGTPFVVTVDSRRNSWKRLSVRLRRVESSAADDSKLGQITFILHYSHSDEFLTVNLLSGHQIHSSDPQFTVCLPVVSIQLQGYPETEVTSGPDDAPNPEYDQEFTFDGVSKDKLLSSVLRFTIWDIISPHGHETRVVGFVTVSLENFHKMLLEFGESGAISREISPYLTFDDRTDFAGELLLSLMYDCVTDRIIVTIRQIKGIFVDEDDVDVYLKVSLLLDNDVIQTKKSATFTSAENIIINQTFEFSALSADLELLTNTTEISKISLELKDKEIEIKSTSSETLRHNMGILCSVRATTVSQLKRVIGRLHVGRTNLPVSDEHFHWEEMVRHFDNTITQWHILKLNY